MVYVSVRNNDVDQALRKLKKVMQREGIFREMRQRKEFEKPCEKRKRKNQEQERRYRKTRRADD